jgi:hypothetical protein
VKAEVLAALLDPAGGAAAECALGRLADGEAARTELARVAAMPREERLKLIVSEVRRALALPQPAPSDEAPAVVAAARGERAGTPPEVRRWLARRLA